MSEFQQVTTRKPCPACSKPDWCAWSPDGERLRCMRPAVSSTPEGMVRISTDSEHTMYGFADWKPDHASNGKPPAAKARKAASIDAAVLHAASVARMTPERLDALCEALGLPAEAVQRLSPGWCDAEHLRAMGAGGAGWKDDYPKGAWAFPERDASGAIIGLGLRAIDGRKGSPKGGERGLTIPEGFDPKAGQVLIVEGQSDVAAALALGHNAVGRPSNTGGVDLLADLLQDAAVVVMGENDRKPDGSWPGSAGAMSVAKALSDRWGRPVQWAMPPEGTKDLRQLWTQHAASGADLLRACIKGAASISPPKQTGKAAKNLPDDESEESKPAQAEQLVRMAMELCRLGQTPKRELFAVMNTGPNIAVMLRGSGGPLRDSLAREYRRRFGRVMNSTAYNDALATLRGEAGESELEPTFIRVGPHGDGVVLDLGTTSGEAVVVDANGWRVVNRSPIVFQRNALTGELPSPVCGGNLDQLRDLLNVTDDTWPILLGWMLAAFVPEMPHPILMLGGEMGTGKTTAAKHICGLFDPSDAPTRSVPHGPEEWAMSVANSWATVIDNVSNIPAWWSDALCKAVTGDGWVRRTLYTDGDVSVLSFRRVIALTSIDAGSLRGDLGDRLVLVDLERIQPNRRRSDRALEMAYQKTRPLILGALLDLLVGVLGKLDTIDVPHLPRMADFAIVLAAMDATLGTNSLALYADQGKRIGGEVLDADPVGEAILTWARQRGEWSGSASDLLNAIKPDHAGREWPKSGRGMAAKLKRLSPALATQGIVVTPPRESDRTRTYFLQAIAQTARSPESGHSGHETANSTRAIEIPSIDERPERPADRPSINRDSDHANGVLGRLGDSGDCAHNIFEADAGWGEM